MVKSLFGSWHCIERNMKLKISQDNWPEENRTENSTQGMFSLVLYSTSNPSGKTVGSAFKVYPVSDQF